MSFWFLSFASDDDGHNLGVMVVSATDFGDALSRAHLLGINPGGSVMGGEVPPGEEPAREDRNRLIVGDDIYRVFPRARIVRRDAAECSECGQRHLDADHTRPS